MASKAAAGVATMIQGKIIRRESQVVVQRVLQENADLRAVLVNLVGRKGVMAGATAALATFVLTKGVQLVSFSLRALTGL
jgi:hypothetical protein